MDAQELLAWQAGQDKVRKKTNRLGGSMCYLAGPMDFVEDRGVGWREDMSDFLWNLGIGVLNPCDNPIVDSLEENDNYYEHINYLKGLSKWDEVERLSKQVVRADLHLIDLCNFCIVHIDTDVHSSGTNTELTYASLEKKPVILVCKQGKRGVPNFLWGLGLSHEMFFGSWQEAKFYIEGVNEDEPKDIPAFGDWRFLDYDKIFGMKGV